MTISIFSGKIKTLTFQKGYWWTLNYTRKKNNVGIPFDSKVMTTDFYNSQLPFHDFIKMKRGQ